MTLDNSRKRLLPGLKTFFSRNEHSSAPSVKRSRRGSAGQPMPMLTPIDTTVTGQPSSSPPLRSRSRSPSPSSSSFSAFVSRPFPPPSLAGVPVEYITDQLHFLASEYWDKPDTADCTIVVPFPHARPNPLNSVPARFPNPPQPTFDLSGLGRRATVPTLNFVPRITLKLHTDYLSAHSSFLRGLFSGASELDLMTSTFNSPLHTASGQFTVPPDRLPRLLPASTPSHPALFLPIPDPTSFHLLVHWMYFGSTCYIEQCLEQGIIQWEGIARNVEYLGLPTEIKVFLGQWYGEWMHPGRAHDELDSDSDSCLSDDDAYYDAEDSSSSSDIDMDMDVDQDMADLTLQNKKMLEVDELSMRGRDRSTRPLSWTSQYSQDDRITSLREDECPA